MEKLSPKLKEYLLQEIDETRYTLLEVLDLANDLLEDIPTNYARPFEVNKARMDIAIATDVLKELLEVEDV